MKGKTRAIKVHTVTGTKPAPLDTQAAAYLAKYESALACYQRADFQAASPLFDEALEIKPSDPVAGVYLDRCETLVRQPPETWDGVFVMKSK